MDVEEQKKYSITKYFKAMKTIKFALIFSFFFIFSVSLSTQVTEHYALMSKVFFYNSAGLVNQTSEIPSPLADSSCFSNSLSMKTLTCFEGVYYQAYRSSKLEPGVSRTVLRKSSDGITWTPMVRVGDGPVGEGEYYQNIYVWRKNNNIHVGIAFVDRAGANDQVRFALSTNGGTSFLPSVQLSSYTDNDNVSLGGITGRGGDTIAVSWDRNGNPTQFSISVNGGVSWSTPSNVYDGGFFTFGTDLVIDNNSNIYTVIGDDQLFKINLVVRKSTNLGASWSTLTPVTNVTTSLMNILQQCRLVNNKIYTVWERNLNTSSKLSDGIFFSESTNFGTSWSAPVDITDTDTLYNASTNFPEAMHPSFTVTPGGTLYAVWSDSRLGHAPTYDSSKFNVYISRSTNGGISWSQNMLVNGPSNYSRVFNGYPAVSVKSTGGTDTVLVSWNKLRDVSTIGITQISTEIPKGYFISQNYPNPFNPSTNIKLGISKLSDVKLVVYDISGRQIEVLFNGTLNAGEYKVIWNSGNISSGVYFYKLITDEFTETKKMLLIK